MRFPSMRFLCFPFNGLVYPIAIIAIALSFLVLANVSASEVSAEAQPSQNDDDQEPTVATGRSNSISGRFIFGDRKALEELKTGNLEISPLVVSKDNKRIFRMVDREPWIELGIPDESLIFGEEGGIANVVVWALEVPEFVVWNGPLPMSTVTAEQGRFQPHVLPFWNLAELNLVNKMAIGVNFHLQGVNTERNSLLAPHGTPAREGKAGSSVKYKLEQERIPVSLRSNFQPWMKSYVLPLKHPCFAVTDKNGRFEIKHLPPGETEFAIWHEKVGWLKTEKFPSGRFKFNVVHTENSIGEVKVDPEGFKKRSPANSPETRDDETKFIHEFKKTLEPKLPQGWSVAVISNRFLIIQPDQKALILPNFGRRPQHEGETDEEYYKDMGAKVTLDVQLRFEPRLSDEAWLKLSGHWADLLESSKNGFRSKTELSKHATLVEKYQLPKHETSNQSIFHLNEGGYRYYSQIVDKRVDQELADVLALLEKSLPVNRGKSAVEGQPKLRWPQVWFSTEATASHCLNKTKAQPLTAEQALEMFNGKGLKPQSAQTIDWNGVPDFDAWIKSKPELADLAQQPPADSKPLAQVVRLSKQQVEVKITRSVGYCRGREYHAAAKHFRIRRSPKVDAVFGLPELEAAHLATYKGIGKFDSQDSVLKQLGNPDHSRVLQNSDSYAYYFKENITLFYRGRQVHTVTSGVPAHVIEKANQDP